MVCQGMSCMEPLREDDSVVSVCTSPPAKRPSNKRNTNPFLPGYQPPEEDPKPSYMNSGASALTGLSHGSKPPTLPVPPRDTSHARVTEAVVTEQPRPRRNKPTAIVGPQMRTDSDRPTAKALRNARTWQDNSIIPLKQQHRRTATIATTTAVVSLSAGNKIPVKLSVVEKMGPMSSYGNLQGKKLHGLNELQQWMGHYCNNRAFSSDSEKPCAPLKLESMPANFSSVIDEYSRVCGYDASQDPALKRACHLLEEAHCYYPKLSMEGARIKLKHSPEGTYLLRDSSDARYLFSLSVKTPRGVTAVRIAYRDGCFNLDCDRDMAQRMPGFECVLQLLQFYTELTRQSANHRSNMCVFLESTGRRDTAVVLSRPRVHTVGSLKGLARKTLNGMLREDQREKLLLFMPPHIEQYMKDYPYHI